MFILTSSHTFAANTMADHYPTAADAWTAAATDYARSDHGADESLQATDATRLSVRSTPGDFETRDHVTFTVADVSPAVAGMVEAAVWTSHTDGDDPDYVDPSTELDPETLATLTADLCRFLAANWDDVIAFMTHTTRPLDHVGHDYWLTRNHHGVGFWDRCYCGSDDAATRLTDASHADGEADLYLTDEGTLSL